MQQLIFFIILVAFPPMINLKPLKVRDHYDPGNCAKGNHGALIVVKDRENKDTILVCTEDEGVYTWKTTEGSKPPGEYFNPGYDCLDILNQNTKAKDGYYWVDFDQPVPHKVWCDMSTDGGGYILIGRMNDTVTWDVPSTNATVQPFDGTQWSSAFGEVPILDFRIQVAIDGQLRKEIKAHWSFRFKNKRPLKNLMMVNEGGCPYNLPGIGDISYVKNLITEEISKNYPCSVFGVYTHPSAKIGWTMMNSCLKEPCPYGFAYHPLFPIQVDFSGGFGFLSVAGNNSTTNDGSTAFFGCDKGKCCACYGPVGGSGVYCGRECKAKNGGRITKNAQAWFWVRLNPPQKVWEKCMEYQTEEENGDAVWYKLVGDRNIPVKGRCGKKVASLNDGIVVVPDDIAAGKLPQITGLLAYQKDVEVLRLRKNGTWKEIAEKEMFQTLNETFTRIELMVNLLRFPSVILSGMPSYINQLKEWLPSYNDLVLCYRASEDTWASSRFHDGCDSKGATVTIIRVKTYIFGGYTDISWGGSSGYKSSWKAFIFSLRNKYNVKPFKADIYQYNSNAIYTYPNYGPTFGGGFDIYIANNAGSSTSSYTNFGYTYRPPSGYSYGSSNTQALLAGSYHFTASEVEVFYLV